MLEYLKNYIISLTLLFFVELFLFFNECSFAVKACVESVFFVKIGKESKSAGSGSKMSSFLPSFNPRTWARLGSSTDRHTTAKVPFYALFGNN